MTQFCSPLTKLLTFLVLLALLGGVVAGVLYYTVALPAQKTWAPGQGPALRGNPAAISGQAGSPGMQAPENRQEFPDAIPRHVLSSWIFSNDYNFR